MKWSESYSVVSNSLWPHGLYSPWNSPGQNTGVGSLSLLQGFFPTQGSNPGLPHCRRILYQLSYKGSPNPMRSPPNLLPDAGQNLQWNRREFTLNSLNFPHEIIWKTIWISMIPRKGQWFPQKDRSWGWIRLFPRLPWPPSQDSVLSLQCRNSDLNWQSRTQSLNSKCARTQVNRGVFWNSPRRPPPSCRLLLRNPGPTGGALRPARALLQSSPPAPCLPAASQPLTVPHDGALLPPLPAPGVTLPGCFLWQPHAGWAAAKAEPSVK